MTVLSWLVWGVFCITVILCGRFQSALTRDYRRKWVVWMGYTCLLCTVILVLFDTICR